MDVGDKMMQRPQPLQFPCSFPLKVLGKNTNEFYAVVRSIIEKHVSEDNEVAYYTKSSSGKNYLSVTATFSAQNQGQLAAIYQELRDHELVLMTL
jgi:uncharacterized protein